MRKLVVSFQCQVSVTLFSSIKFSLYMCKLNEIKLLLLHPCCNLNIRISYALLRLTNIMIGWVFHCCKFIGLIFCLRVCADFVIIIHSTHCQELMKLWVVVGWQLATQCYSSMLNMTFTPQIPKVFKPLTHFSLLTSLSFQFSYPPRALKIWLKFPFYVPKLPFKVSLSMYLLSPASNLFY